MHNSGSINAKEEGLVQEEINALSQMAEQINTKLNQPTAQVALKNQQSSMNGHNPSIGATHQQSNESVDLDNLFAFLSEVTPSSNSNPVLNEIGEKMDSLVQDLDVELESVILQEIEGLALEKPLINKIPPGKGVPTLPEPTMPPPPPPTIVTANENITNSTIPVVTKVVKRSDEPIYEAVLPKDPPISTVATSIVSQIPNAPLPPPSTMVPGSGVVIQTVSMTNSVPHHISQPLQDNSNIMQNHLHHKLRPKSPAITNVVRSASPIQKTNSGPMSPSSPKHSRPSSRTSLTGGNHSHVEREQRRKHRVEKKLQEMHQFDAYCKIIIIIECQIFIKNCKM